MIYFYVKVKKYKIFVNWRVKDKMFDFLKSREVDLKVIRKENDRIFNHLFDIIEIPFENTTELQRQVLATFSFGMLNAIANINKLTPPDVHALTIIMLEETFKYSKDQSVAFADDLIKAVACKDPNNTHKAIIHRGIDGHYQYINGQLDKVKENILNIFEILEGK